jgi:hypothetical protein
MQDAAPRHAIARVHVESNRAAGAVRLENPGCH